MFGDAGLGGGDGDLGGGDTALVDGDAAIGSGDGDLEGGDGVVGDGDVGGGDFCLFFQRRRASLESGGGIGITGEPARCTVSVFFC